MFFYYSQRFQPIKIIEFQTLGVDGLLHTNKRTRDEDGSGDSEQDLLRQEYDELPHRDIANKRSRFDSGPGQQIDSKLLSHDHPNSLDHPHQVG